MTRPRSFEPLDFPLHAEWRQRRGILLRQPKGRGPNGRKLCRWCSTEIPPKRSAWCGDECVRRFLRVSTWQALATYILERDGARCQRCGTDAPGWLRTREFYAGSWSGRNLYGNYCNLVPWWEVDHIVPVVDGGTDDPANLRLLCHACHVAVGYEQRRARKARVQLELAEATA